MGFVAPLTFRTWPASTPASAFASAKRGPGFGAILKNRSSRSSGAGRNATNARNRQRDHLLLLLPPPAPPPPPPSVSYTHLTLPTILLV
eukprot:4010690-Pyramimonas_sp.AAC.1